MYRLPKACHRGYNHSHKLILLQRFRLYSPKYNSLPHHYIIIHWCTTYSTWWIVLELPKIAHQSSSCRSRHFDCLSCLRESIRYNIVLFVRGYLFRQGYGDSCQKAAHSYQGVTFILALNLQERNASNASVRPSIVVSL